VQLLKSLDLQVSAEMLLFETLVLIGMKGFNYQLGELSNGGNGSELSRAFNAIFKTPPKLSLFRVFLDIFPRLEIFVRPFS
jgi:hypothetical protein